MKNFFVIDSSRLCFAFGVASIVAVILGFLVLDPWLGYLMCSLCLVQRAMLLGVGVGCVLLAKTCCCRKKRIAMWLLSTLCAVIGLYVSIWHVRMLAGADVGACPLSIKQGAMHVWGSFFGAYRWVSCDTVREAFFGASLAVWSSVYFTCACSVLGYVAYRGFYLKDTKDL